MKNNLLFLLSVFVMLFSLLACGGEKQLFDTPKNYKEKSVNSNKGKSGGEIDIGDEILLEDGKFSAVIEDVNFVKDINDKPSINVKYSVTNNTDQEKTILEMVIVILNQDGKDLDFTSLKEEEKDPDAIEDFFKPIKPGKKSGIVESTFLIDSEKDVTILISNLADSVDGMTYTMNYSLPK